MKKGMDSYKIQKKTECRTWAILIPVMNFIFPFGSKVCSSFKSFPESVVSGTLTEVLTEERRGERGGGRGGGRGRRALNTITMPLLL